jgi:hypothetical protein
MTLGVPYVEFIVPTGSAASIQRFYEKVLGAPSSVEMDAGETTTRVEVGVNQQLVFRERERVADYDGHHIAIYIANFSGPFQFLQERNLITEDIRNHQFRFRDIVNPNTNQPVFTLEHEVRSSRHPFYRRQLTNREPENPPMATVGRA